jgi:hypothetical protein
MSVQIPNNTAYGLSQAILQLNAPAIVSKRNPTVRDRGQYGQSWVNTTTGICFQMTSIAANSYTWYAVAAAAAAYAAAGTVTAGTGLRATTGAGNPGAKGLLVDAGGAGITGVVDITGATNIVGALGVTGAVTATTAITAGTTIESGTTMTCGTGLTVTAGGIAVTAGDLALTLGSVDITDGNIHTDDGDISTSLGNITATQGNIIATLGDITATEGDITATLGDIIATQGSIKATLGDIIATEGNIKISHAANYLALPGPVKVMSGAGAPANALAAAVGDMYINTTAASAVTRIYVATAANTWTNVTCAA